MAKHFRPLKVLLVEGDLQLRTAISNALAAERAFQLATVCSTKREAMRAIRENTLDMAMIALKLPDGSGLEVVEAVNCCQPAADVLVVGTSDDKELIMSSMEAGATGCLLKEALLRGKDVHVNSMLAVLLFSRIHRNIESVEETAKTEAEFAGLPHVQREILRCLSRGLSNKEIARDLILTSYNVDYHLKRLRKRFSVHNRVQLVGAAMTLFEN